MQLCQYSSSRARVLLTAERLQIHRERIHEWSKHTSGAILSILPKMVSCDLCLEVEITGVVSSLLKQLMYSYSEYSLQRRHTGPDIPPTRVRVSLVT